MRQLFKALIYSARREYAFDKKNDKQTAERPIRHIDSYPSGRLDRNSVDMSELYSKISFSAVHTDI